MSILMWEKLREMDAKLDALLALAKESKKQGASIMATEQQLLDVIKQIDTATTAQGTALTAEAATLQHISDDFDKLIAQIKPGTVSDATLAALQAQADKVAAVSASITKQADFSTALAARVDNPVPVPQVPPTPPTP